MQIINIREAKTQLFRLVERAAAGEEIVIGRAGKPVARLIPYQKQRGLRTPGIWRGRVKIAEDFGTLPEALSGAFRGDKS